MTTISSADPVPSNPIDQVETLISYRDWIFERRGEQEMAVEAPGHWCDYAMYFSWSEDLDALHFSCAFDMRTPKSRRADVFELLAILNERLWIGHFGLWSESGTPMFRHTVLLSGGRLSREALDDLIEVALSECERFYPAFQFAVWGGKSAHEAVDAALLDTMGEA